MGRGFKICKGYDNKGINLPKRQTENSAAYDIESAEEIVVPSLFNDIVNGVNKTDFKPTLIKTGIKAYFEADETLLIFNRSSRSNQEKPCSCKQCWGY